LATNAVFQQSASLVACEMLFILWAFIAWIAIERIVEREDQPLANSWTRVWYPVLVGVALGLGYLTKASAVFLLVGFLGWSVSLPGLRRWSWLTLVAFAVVASPLLIRNTRAYGDPFYSVNNRFLFSDTFEEGLDREFFGTWPAAKEYWSTHTIGGMAKRLFTGLGWEGYVLLRSLGPVTSSNSSVLVGLVVLLLAILGSMGWDRRIVGAALSWLIPFFVFFAWYGVIARGDRFLAPLVPIMLISAARGAAVLLQTGAPASDRALARRVVLTAVLWCVATVAMSWRLARQLPVVPEAVGSVPTMPDEWRSSR
jgi:hypothetical protein